MTWGVYQWAAQAPDAVAARWRDAVVTAGELARRVAAVAPTVRALAPGVPAAVAARNDVDTWVFLLACLEAGVPVFPVSPAAPPQERECLVAACGAGGLWEEGRWLPLPHGRPLPACDRDPAVLMATSGTTGRPRIAVLSAQALRASAAASAANLGWRDDDGWIAALPLYHMGGLSIAVRCLLARKPLFLTSGFAVSEMERAVAAGATLLSAVPTAVMRLLDAGGAAVLRRLRAVLVGGAAADPALVDRCDAHQVPVLLTYGMTQTASQVATWPLDGPRRLVPLPGVAVRVVDEGQRPLPPGVRGRVCVRGPMLMERYVDGDPVGPWYCTDDIGVLEPDGSLRVLGRADDVIITGGVNVDPGEVEAVLTALPQVRQCVVFGVSDPRWGQKVACAVVCAPDFDLRRLRAAAKRALHPAKAPRSAAVLDAFPLLPSGKVDRGAVRRMALAALRPIDETARGDG